MGCWDVAQILFLFVVCATSAFNALVIIPPTYRNIVGYSSSILKTSANRRTGFMATFDNDSDGGNDVKPSVTVTKRKRKRSNPIADDVKQFVLKENEISEDLVAQLPELVANEYKSKKVSNSSPKPSSPTAARIVPRHNEPVTMKMTSIRDLIHDNDTENGSVIDSISSFAGSSFKYVLSSVVGSPDNEGRNKDLQSQNKYQGEPRSSSVITSQLKLDDSLDQLLEDARQMKAREEIESRTVAEGRILSDQEGKGFKSTIENVLSTIVTADFFVVCGFLLWFLLGILFRSLGNDAVQISFNKNFERLVQPALGILMLASIGGSFFKEEE